MTSTAISGCTAGVADTTDSGAAVSFAVASVEEKKKKEKKEKPWMITDMNGKERELKIGNVNTEDVGVEIEVHSVAAAHSQVLNDHYYYVRKVDDHKYTLYRDRGDKVGSFKFNKVDSFAGCAVYDGQFYVLVDNNKKTDSGQWFYALAVVDFSNGEPRKLDVIPDWNMYFYKKQIYQYLYNDKTDAIKLKIMDMKGNKKKILSISDNEPITINGIIDGMVYYIKKNDKEAGFFRQDIENGETEEFFHYEPSMNAKSVDFQMDKGGIFFEEYFDDDSENEYETMYLYLVPWSGKRMLKVTKVNAIDYCYNSQYVFYRDRYSQIHRWNRKTMKEDKVIKTKIHRDSFLDCTKDGLFIQECTDEKHNLYFMDLDGKRIIKIWDDAKYVEEEWEEDDDGEEDYRYTYW